MPDLSKPGKLAELKAAFGPHVIKIALLFVVPLWVFMFLVIGGGSFLFGSREILDPERSVLSAASPSSPGELAFCLKKGWYPGLTLQSVGSPPAPVAERLHNAVRHITVDIVAGETGSVLHTYREGSERLPPDAEAALLRCATRGLRIERAPGN